MSMTSLLQRRSTLRSASILLGTLLLNAVVLMALSYMNKVAARRPSDPGQDLRVTRFAAPLATEEVEVEQPEDEPLPEEAIRLDLDLPVPEFRREELDLRMPPLSLEWPSMDTDTPDVGSVAIAVRPTIQPAITMESSAPAVAGPMRSDGVDEPPRASPANLDPKYPRSALRRGREGLVVVDLLIDENGRVERVELLSGDEPFVGAVMKVVRDWRFTPARHQGREISVWGTKRFRFDKQDRAE